MATAAADLFTRSACRAYPRRTVSGLRRIGMAGTLGEAFMDQRPALLRFLRARGAGEDAEDMIQELWLKLEAASAVQADDALAYLYRMAHNLMLDRRRAAVRRRLREENYQGTGVADDTPDAEQALLARDRLRHVDRALAALGRRTDYIFRRHRVDGIPQRDIAAELGVTLSAVEKHLQKAYRALVSAQSAYAQDSEPAIGLEAHDDAR